MAWILRFSIRKKNAFSNIHGMYIKKRKADINHYNEDTPSLENSLTVLSFRKNIYKNNKLSLFNVHSRGFNTSIVLHGEKDILVPPFPQHVTEGDVIWVKKVGERVSKNDLVCYIETDKTVIEVHSPADGVILAQYVHEGQIVKSMEKICRIQFWPKSAKRKETEPQASPILERAQESPTHQTKSQSSIVVPSSEKSLPKPSSPPPTQSEPQSSIFVPSSERQSKKSIFNTELLRRATPSGESFPGEVEPQDATSKNFRNEYKVKMTEIRKRVAQRIKQSQNEAALLTTFNEIDMTNTITFRKAYQEAFKKKYGINVGFLSTFLKAAAYALQDQPVINACIMGNEIVYRDYIDISIAIATPNGLAVPVIRNVSLLNFAEIEKSINDLVEKAGKGELTVDDMDGGTFSINNGEVFGSLMGTPMVNPPQSAILGIHETVERPVAVQGRVAIRPMMYVALTYDHRLIDGREAVLFLRTVKNTVENPLLMIAGV